MGRTMRWIKGFLGINGKEKGQNQTPNSGVRQSCLGHSGREPVETDGLCQNPNTIPPNITPAEAAWLRSFYNDSDDNEQSKHAIAVAAATAAAADAAVAAAQAAVAVVRLTSQGRGTMFASGVGGGRERWGATKIQTVFRGYLARKALRALKGLVKLQALVRGYMVRKQAAATFQSMKALIRAQASIRAQRNRGLLNASTTTAHMSPSQYHARKSAERIVETTSQQQSSFHSRRLSASFDSINTNIAMEESPKIVEMDTGRPKSRSRRSMVSYSGDDNSSDHHSLSSPCPYPPPPPRLSIPEWQSSIDPEWSLNGDDNRGYTTAQSTPRFATSCGNNVPITPAKSVCVESLFRNYGNCPNYMVDTQSFKAKLRSQSAPKHRPEPSGPKRRQSIHEMMGSRNSLSGVRMQRSCSHAQETINFKNAVISKLGRSTEFTREQCRDYYMQ